MEKLTLKELAPYLPYRLRVVLGTTERDLTAVSIDSKYVFVSAYKGSRDKQMAGIESIKPILRPLSDLTKEIEVNGKKIIPLIELYRCSNEYNYNEDLDYEFIDSWAHKGNILKVFHNREKDEYTEFVFSELSFRKERKHLKGSYVFGMYLPHNIAVDSKLYNNNKLYNLLYIWHFDVFGLIDKNLAVPVTENFNPYK